MDCIAMDEPKTREPNQDNACPGRRVQLLAELDPLHRPCRRHCQALRKAGCKRGTVLTALQSPFDTFRQPIFEWGVY